MPVASESTTTPHGLRRQAIVQSLLADVIHGRFRAGEHLVTQDLARRFGVSHTPIREALIALAGMGILEMQPNRGAVVRRLSHREVFEITQVRRVLECAATRLACGRIAPTVLADLATRLRVFMIELEQGNADRIARARDLDSRLHDAIADQCGNSYLAQEIHRLKTLFRVFRDVAWEHDAACNDWHRLAEEAREHLAIVEALQAGQPRPAAQAMARHIRSGYKYWSRALVESTTDPSAKPPISRHSRRRDA